MTRQQRSPQRRTQERPTQQPAANPCSGLHWRRRRWRCLRGGGGDDRGSVSLFAVTAATGMIILAGLAVDLAGQVHARQHAVDVARQAARAAGQQLQPAPAVRGDGLRTDPQSAVAAARSYLAAADVTGSVSLHGGTVVVVTTSARYDTVFLSIIGIDQLQVSGRSEARTLRAVHGVER